MADSQGVLARTLAAVKYAFTGSAPAQWFGPLQPLAPQAPDEVAGRQWDYPVGFNINYAPRSTEPVGFVKLKALAQNSDILRAVMEGQKDKIEALSWTVKPRPDDKGRRVKADSSVIEIQRQLEFPDRVHDWAQWLRSLLEQLYVLDALSIYRRRDRGGRPYAFEIVDGATIKPLLDASGRRPEAPNPAYQQVLKGIPAVNYTPDELLYYPQNVRVDHAYGYSRVEQIIVTIETAIERARSQKGFFTHGNLSDGFFTAPENTLADQLRQVEAMWNGLLNSSVENRRVNQFLPGGYKWNQIGAPPLQDEFDEWLARVICFTFSTAPTPFLKQQGMGHGSATSEHEAAEAAGLANIMGYVRRVMNRLLIEDFGRPDLEFDWIEDREFDPESKAKIEDQRLRNGTLTIDEVRDRNGEDPLPDGLGAKPLIYNASGATLLADLLEPPEPKPLPAPLAPGATPVEEPKPGEDPALEKAASREKRLAAVLGRYLAKRGAEIATQLGDALGLAKAAPSDPSSDDHSHRIEEALDEVDWDWTDLAPQVQPGIAGVSVAAGRDALSELNLFDKAMLSKMTATATNYSEARAAELVGRRLVDGELVDNPGWSIPSATRDMVRAAVTHAMESGASNDELAAAISESDAFSKARATTIARTETAKADSEGARAGWRASGLVAGREWAASAGCCDDCQALDGVIVGLDEDYPDGADLPLHPNCECTELAVLPEDMPDAGEDD